MRGAASLAAARAGPVAGKSTVTDTVHGGQAAPSADALAGVSERISMLQTGHKNIAVFRRSIREGSIFCENAAAAVGL